jgi:hypothetical protein
LIDFPDFFNFEEPKKNTMASISSQSSRGVGVRFWGSSVRLLALFLFGVVFFSAMIDQAEGE